MAPYIAPMDRESLESFTKGIAKLDILDEGELNYLVTKLVDRYINARGKRYTVLNAVIGVLESAKLELYRRIVAPYEDLKKTQNGDVYGAS